MQTNLLAYDPAKHAQLITHYCLSAQPNERLLVGGSTASLPLVGEVHRAMLRAGARPVLRLTYPGQDEDFAALASDAVLDNVHAADLEDVRGLDGSVRIIVSEDLPEVDPRRRARLLAARAPLQSARARKKWSLTLYPTPHGARKAGMTPEQYEDFVMRAMSLDRADPVAAWGELRERQAQLIERISRADQVQIQSANADLTLSVKGRTWANSDGKRNMPSGEIFTGPLEDSASGWVRFDIPATYQGVMVRGARLEFKEGKVVAATADEGQDTLLAALDTDPGARFLGELGIGTNDGIQQPSGNILFDEKIGGTVHLAVGRSYPETGGTNESAVHWDLITDLRNGGRLLLDGEVWQENGVFVAG
ncbi:aminopeptidase [Deinococcus fonticola]|uniref:aminopeptidase n=1 Tax=Deinococcus fonticola TaxID=2528713 RepID=UPI0010755185|nr:aminopeptidase [Deinococcus fonticola]